MASQNRERQVDTPQSSYIVAYNSPTTLKTAPQGEQYSKAYIETIIRQKADLAGIDPDLMVRIAKAESGLAMKWNSRHWEAPDYYTAYGPFQIIAGHEKTYGISRMTLEGNIDLAIRIYLKEGLKPWQLSRSGWEK